MRTVLRALAEGAHGIAIVAMAAVIFILLIAN